MDKMIILNHFTKYLRFLKSNCGESAIFNKNFKGVEFDMVKRGV